MFSSVLESIRSKVYATDDTHKISYFETYGTNIECVLRNTYRTKMCSSVQKDLYPYSDGHSRIEYTDENGEPTFKRLCKNPKCRYAHNIETKRNQIVCLEYIFGVCKYTESHEDKLHSSSKIEELPSYCFYTVYTTPLTFFCYHNMIRMYNKQTNHTYVIEFPSVFFTLTSSFTEKDRKDRCKIYIETIKDYIYSEEWNTLPFIKIEHTETFCIPYTSLSLK